MAFNSDLKAIVASTMRHNAYNSKDAIDALIEQSRKDDDLLDDLLRLGADQAVRTYFHSERRVAAEEQTFEKYTPRPTPDTPEKAVAREHKIERRLFWDRYALFGQTPLIIAKQPDLITSEKNRRKQAAGNIACADFEADLRKRMKDKTTAVGKFFTIGKVVELAKLHNVI